MSELAPHGVAAAQLQRLLKLLAAKWQGMCRLLQTVPVVATWGLE